MKKKFDKAKQNVGRLMVKLNPGRRSRSHSPIAPDPDLNASTPEASIGRHSYADPNAPQTVIGITCSVVNEFLGAARDGADLCLPLKAALVGAVKIFEICERTSEIRHQYEQLGSRLAHLGAVTGVLSKRNYLDPSLLQRLENIAETFSRLTACIEGKQARGTVRRVLESQADVSEVKDILLKITARIEAFMFESMVRVEIGVDSILERLPKPEELELEKELSKWKATREIIEKSLGVRRVYSAAHDAQPEDAGCMVGTRLDVLCKFIEWVRNDPKSIFWLAGMAGTGKTSVAVSLCRMLQEDSEVLLGGAFFCSRASSDEARSDVRRIIPTLAALLADHSPVFAAELAAELRPSSGAAAHKQAGEQIGPLLQRPLAALASESRPIVFVIDALDECNSEREVHALLKGISTFTCPTRVKFILTSRPETHILGSLISDRSQNEIFHLHMIDPKDVSEDIRLYIDHTFEQNPLDGPEPWYLDADVSALASLSNGLFIFASTAIAYILDTDAVEDRSARLHTVLSAMKRSKVATGPLDDVYEFVITRASNETKVEPQELAKTRRVLACILTARMPLSIEALAELLGQKPDVVRASLRRLRALVHVPEELDQPGLRTLHASFGDYMFERSASQIRIERSLGDDALARGCLRVMEKRLHFNVSRSHSSYHSNALKRPDSITLSLEYACLQWVYHVAGLSDSSALDEMIHQIFCPRTLFWLEVMSVLSQVHRAAAMMIIASAVARSTQLSRFLRDANSFIASSSEAIKRSAPHIYISALPFAAKLSLIYQTFVPLCKGLVSVEANGIDSHAGWLVMTMHGHENGVNTVAYSSDDRLIGSGSVDGSVRIWDPRTGDEAMSPLHGGDGWINSISFSPDGSSIASGTQAGFVCIWSLVADHTTPRKLSGHTDLVESVLFSPDGLILASTSLDKTLRLWNVETGQVAVVLSGHASSIIAIAFSPNGQLIASSLEDNMIQMIQVATGDHVGQPFCGHTRVIYSISFSPDGTLLASGSSDCDIRLWDIRTGANIATLKGHSASVTSVQFAPVGRSLVSAAYDSTVRLWTIPHDAAEATSVVLGRHKTAVKSVAFSQNGMYIASASNDCSIRIWDAESGQTASHPLSGHDNSVNSATLSFDGALIVSGSDDNSVRVWNTHTGDPELPPLLGHRSSILSAIISSDGHLIASASRDCTVQLWDAMSGERIGEPLQAHEDWVRAVAFSPDVRWLASASEDRTVCIWDMARRPQSNIGHLNCDDSVRTVAFSPDGQLIAAGDHGGCIYLWETASFQPVCEPIRAGEYAIRCICFTPDSMRIISGGSNTGVLIWDVSTRQQVFALDGHTDSVRSVACSHDGRFVVSGSVDKTVRLWDATNGAPIAKLQGQGGFVNSVAFTPNGSSIISCSSDQTIRVWDLAVACATVSDGQGSILDGLASTDPVDEWLLGSSGELMLWIPPDYRAHLLVPPCTSIIAHHHVTIKDAVGGASAGTCWTSCWMNLTSNDRR